MQPDHTNCVFRCWEINENMAHWWIIRTPILLAILVMYLHTDEHNRVEAAGWIRLSSWVSDSHAENDWLTTLLNIYSEPSHRPPVTYVSFSHVTSPGQLLHLYPHPPYPCSQTESPSDEKNWLQIQVRHPGMAIGKLMLACPDLRKKVFA